MPTIEILPQTQSTHSHHGVNWAYTTLPPAHSVSGTLPSGTSGRGQRARANNYENSAARQRQINARISELEKDNYRDVVIPIPKSDAKRASYRSRHTATQNVRRVLQSQKTFVNHLADEEALHPGVAAPTSQQRNDDTTAGVGSDDEMDIDTPETKAREEEDGTPPVIMIGGNILDGGPPLGYARAVSRPSKQAERKFCEICGYWGNYRCGKCGARYCDTHCMALHLETACNKLYR
ncbi:hypothetical protein EX30DRAFT_339610 [Ascodesmis nigricans]|uniref:HIT-type domain-containing protein n=1 Tax=Ascodesmis nigricans TaxID=341454 RepID=A0A4S2N3A5_9PEZI|nr:hypothetical protein EX30DRAFT_339610 [Ascodesmis nigricans]